MLIHQEPLKKGLLVEIEVEDGVYFILNKELDITEQGITLQAAMEKFLSFMVEDFKNLRTLEPNKLDFKLTKIYQMYREFLV